MLNEDERDWLYTNEVAARFKVGPKTISRWAKDGKLPVASKTLGKHRRYDKAAVAEIELSMRGEAEG